MISPQDIQHRARRLWASGRPLRSWLGAEALFPYTIPFRKPSAQDWLARFAELRAAAEQLERAGRATVGSGYSVEFVEVAHQKLGRIRVPQRISFDSVEDLAVCAGESEALRRFQAIADTLRSGEPRLMEWVARRPMSALACEATLPRLLAVVGHFQAHPRPMRYARELGIPGVDSKFIEENRTILSEWLDVLLPVEAIDTSARGMSDGAFERRYGLRYEEPLIRFRWLDRTHALAQRITDATVPLSEFASYNPSGCRRVLVTENKINFLTLPDCDGGLAIFGGGYGSERLGGVPWLRERPIFYWGDIDTHGFAILSRLRRLQPHTRSLLMDRETLLAHREVWSEEPEDCRCLHDLDALDQEEAALYDDLRRDSLGVRVRLEQERIAYSFLGKTMAYV